MRILSSLWSLLITEDEMVTKLITAPTVLLEAWLVFELIVNIFKVKFTKVQILHFIILQSFNSLISEFVIPAPYNVLINYLSMFIIIKIIFRLESPKCIACTILPTIFFALTSMLLLKPFLVILNITYTQVESVPLYRFLYLFLIYSFIYVAIVLIKNNTIRFNFKYEFDKQNKYILIINLLLGFFTLCVEMYISYFYIDVLPIFINFLSFITTIAYFFISIYSLSKTLKLQITTKDLENAENYNKTLSFMYDNVRAFKHDFDNIVFIIGGFINTNDIDGLKNYYVSLEKDCQKVNGISLLNPTLINNPGIYSLLMAKYKKATNENVDINLDFFFDLTKLHMPIYDFSRMLGILIDNAIEAAATTIEKHVKISFRDSTYTNVQIIKIENSYSNKNIDKKRIFEKGVTEKKNHTGMGLWEVNQIVKRNNNIKLITEPGNELFSQTLEIYY